MIHFYKTLKDVVSKPNTPEHWAVFQIQIFDGTTYGPVQDPTEWPNDLLMLIGEDIASPNNTIRLLKQFINVRYIKNPTTEVIATYKVKFMPRT
jgi:hypothetical protein